MLLLRRRDFALLWAGGLVSLAGSWVLGIALALHLYRETGSAFATAGVLIASVAPGVLFGALGGVVADRFDRRRVLVWANVALCALTLPLLALEAGAVWVAYPVLVAVSIVSQLVPPAEHALLPRLVPDEDLVEANALNTLNNSLARLCGPVLGTAVFALGGIGAVVLVDALSYLAAAALVALVRTSGAVEHPAAGAADVAAGAVRRTLRDVREGLGAVVSRPVVRLVFAFAAVAALGEGVFGTVWVIWVAEVLGGGVSEVGWLMSGQAVGGIAGGLVGGWVGRRFSAERIAGAGLLLFGVLDLALFNYPRVVDAFAVGLALIVLVGVPGALARAAQATLLQREVPDRLRGRVFGALGTVAAGLMLAGALLAGALAGALGPLVLLNLQGGAYVASGLLVLATFAHMRRGGLGRPVEVPAGRAGP